MIQVKTSRELQRIPSLLKNFFIDYLGNIYLEKLPIDLEEFNNLTNLDIDDVNILILVTFHNFRWPPVYWKYLKVIRTFNEEPLPENMLLGISDPVESLEYKDFYMIPYFSNYVVSHTGLLIKKSTGLVIQPSETIDGYFTYRMTGDNDRTQNYNRHRILALAFLEYNDDIERLEVNHIDGIKGNDDLSNLEWVTPAQNIAHAIEHGLNKPIQPIAVRNIHNGNVYIYTSYSEAARAMNMSRQTIARYAKTEGYRAFNGYQFMNYTSGTNWPEIENESGLYKVTFTNGESKLCSCKEAAELCDVTRTSLLRLLREGRNKGRNENTVERMVLTSGD